MREATPGARACQEQRLRADLLEAALERSNERLARRLGLIPPNVIPITKAREDSDEQ